MISSTARCRVLDLQVIGVTFVEEELLAPLLVHDVALDLDLDALINAGIGGMSLLGANGTRGDAGNDVK